MCLHYEDNVGHLAIYDAHTIITINHTHITAIEDSIEAMEKYICNDKDI